MSSPQVGARKCPPEVDDSTFSGLMLTRAVQVPNNKGCSNPKGVVVEPETAPASKSNRPSGPLSKGRCCIERCMEPEGEPEGEVIWENNASWGQSLHVVVRKPSFLGAATVPNLIRKAGMCMMMLSAIALNLTVIGALVKSHQSPGVISTTKPKSIVARAPSSNLPPIDAKSKAKSKPVQKDTPQVQAEKKHDDPSEKVMSDSSEAANFVIPVPLPPAVPLPPTVTEPMADPAATSLKSSPGTSIASDSVPDSQDTNAVQNEAVSESQNDLSVKMAVPQSEVEEVKVTKDLPQETTEEKEDRERKKLRALLIQAEEDLGAATNAKMEKEETPMGGSRASVSGPVGLFRHNDDENEEGEDEDEDVEETKKHASGRLHTEDPDSSGGGKVAKMWGTELQQQLDTMKSAEASRRGPAKFMRQGFESLKGHALLKEHTRKIREAQAKKKKEKDEDEDEEVSDQVNEAKKPPPSTAFGFR